MGQGLSSPWANEEDLGGRHQGTGRQLQVRKTVLWSPAWVTGASAFNLLLISTAHCVLVSPSSCSHGTLGHTESTEGGGQIDIL